MPQQGLSFSSSLSTPTYITVNFLVHTHAHCSREGVAMAGFKLPYSVHTRYGAEFLVPFPTSISHPRFHFAASAGNLLSGVWVYLFPMNFDARVRFLGMDVFFLFYGIRNQCWFLPLLIFSQLGVFWLLIY